MGAAKDPKITPDAKAAHELLTELRTRVSIQPLPYQDGDETTALESLVAIFDHAREAIKKNPGCAEFARLTADMLNGDLRRVTAQWHPRSIAGELKTRDGAADFRSDLADLRLRLRGFANTLHNMAYGSDFSDIETPPAIDQAQLDKIFADLPFGIPEKHLIDETIRAKINESEASEIAARREKPAEALSNGVGLALSGGGIRSASFCLGACQALADRGMLEHVDFLSTVSGGGYTGAFVAGQMAARPADPTITLKKRNGPDSDEIRGLRAKVKYLAPSGVADKWSMICSIVAGMVLNWTAPAAIICLLVLGAVLTQNMWVAALPHLLLIAVIAAALGLIGYAISLRIDRTRAIKRFSVLAALAVALIALSLIPPLHALYQHLKAAGGAAPSMVALVAALTAVLPTFLRVAGMVNRKIVEKALLNGALFLASIAVPVIGLVFGFALWDLTQASVDLRFLPDVAARYLPQELSGASVIAALALSLGLIAIFTLNLNLTGPGRLYRNRLARSFVATAAEEDSFVPLKTLNTVTDATGAASPGKAPYHLINATLNLPNSRSPVLRERKGDFFVMSKHWTGAPSAGYLPTAAWKTSDGDLDLATAIATSGAAVSPHMSLMTIPSITALMAFLNLRLGFWIRKPGAAAASLRPGFLNLLKEMFSWGMDEKRDWLLLSDGAHVDNSGIYELLRRRCKFIIACDASADNNDSFATLMTVVRHAQIDFGVQIMPRLEELKSDLENGQTAAHTLMCQIKYPDQPDGLLLVLKSSVTGNESEFIKTYRSANPEFPNQSTLDQDFDEAQFEAYRQLGAHVVDGLFVPSILGPGGPPASVSAWFRRLATNLLPRQA